MGSLFEPVGSKSGTKIKRKHCENAENRLSTHKISAIMLPENVTYGKVWNGEENISVKRLEATKYK